MPEKKAAPAPGGAGKPRLFLVDGSALAYRSHFALGGTNLSTTKGEPTGAVYGFASTLWSIIRDEKPDYLAVFFERAARMQLAAMAAGGYREVKPELAAEAREFLLQPSIVRGTFAYWARRSR